MVFLYVFPVAYLFQCGYGRQRGQERVTAVCIEGLIHPFCVSKIPDGKPEVRLVRIMWVVEDRHEY